MTFEKAGKALVVAACGACLFAGPARAAETNADSLPHNDTVEKIASWLRPIVRPGDGKYVVLPKITYSSEAGLGFGAEVGRAFQWGSLYAADSDIRLTGRVTVNGDGEASATLNLGWLDKKYTFKTKIEYDDIPLSFYGVGPDTPDSNRETYQRQSVLGYLEVFRRITKHFRVGVRGEINSSVMLEVEPGGLLDSGDVPGTDAATIYGAGVLAFYDSRERRFSPRRGQLHQFFWLRFSTGGAEEYEFNVINADFRWFFPVRSNDVIAAQLFGYFLDETPPFWRFAAVGGREHSRGYRKGRYLDKVMGAAQLEYRKALWWRVGLVGFGGIAGVQSDIQSIDFANVRPTVGGGLRFLLGPNGGRARLDVAFGDEFRFYFRLDESF